MNNRDDIHFLWDYEEEAVRSFLPSSVIKGRLDLPTGGGKGVIGRELAFRLAEVKKSPFVAVFFTPRLLLNQQWARACNTHLNKKHKQKWHLIYVGSDPAGNVGIEFEKEHKRIGVSGTLPAYSTTNSKNLQQRVDFLIRSGYNVLIISTYHSNSVVRKAGFHIDLAFYDEAHFLPTGKSELVVCEDDFFSATELEADKKVFATATPRLTASSNGRGMNNEEVYGPVVFSYTPKQLIETGAIVGPILHVIGTNPELDGILNVEDDSFDFSQDAPDVNVRSFNLQSDMIFEAHAKHKEVVVARSCSPSRVGAKILVVCNGQGNMRGIFESRRFKELRQSNRHIKIYGLCVDWGIEFDGHRYKLVSNKRKEEFLESVWGMKLEDDAIIFHVDMIGVGLDVPMLTGVLFLRSCNLTKFQQNIGRAARLHPDDREKIENCTLVVGDYTNYVKPRYDVIVPYCFEDKEDFYKRYRDWLVELRGNYGFDPSEMIAPVNMQPAPVDDPDDSLPPSMRGITQQDIVAFYHRIEQDEMLEEQISLGSKFIQQVKSGDMDVIARVFSQRS